MSAMGLEHGLGLHALHKLDADTEAAEEVKAEVPDAGNAGDETEELETGPEAPMYCDHNDGEVLPKCLAERARGEEFRFMDKWNVWDIVPVEECRRTT